ncbi:hypothetical protein NP233_g7737 [Leucocoprinus birnbaumii]|uniref:NAD(P)-binding protein n=1 Tax=Leucocoprinus birnbaumii TaxID=56174 RepID=A0AAD5VRB4_9AGAR|nr:hypothetical protein NP233_g7737 [Leucocoprinus birnbaumii]
MAVPDEDMTKEALERVEKEGREPGLGEVIWHELDLKDPRTAKASAEKFMEREKTLDLLINNAALTSDRGNPQLNSDGVQLNMAINYLGPFVFTQTLLPLLERTAADGKDVRIVNVGSAGHQDVTYLSFGSKEEWNYQFRFTLIPPLSRYKYSKMAVHLWTNHLARRLTSSGSNVLLLVVQPGAILSDGAMMHPQERGAFTSVFAGCAPRDDPNIHHGVYLVPPNVEEEQSATALDKDKQDELYGFTVKLLGDAGIEVQGLEA